VSAVSLGWPSIDAPGSSALGLDSLVLGADHDLDPKQATVLIVAGRLTRALAPLVRATYEQLATSAGQGTMERGSASCTKSAWVIAYGTCAISGAVFATPRLGQICPVDIVVPGCPPHPDALWQALLNVRYGSMGSKGDA
jgi:NADH-quinone oxidoreductase subunit B